jgi:hypothetical protein
MCNDVVCLFDQVLHHTQHKNRDGGVMVSVLASSAVDREFEPRSGQISNCCLTPIQQFFSYIMARAS